MTEEEKKSRIEWLEEELELLKYEIANGEESEFAPIKQKRWKPKKKETYWYINAEGEIEDMKWADDDLDNYIYDTNNCFEFKEQAYAKADKIQTEIELRKYVEEHDRGIIDWNDDDQEKFILYHDSKTGEIDVDSVWTMMFPHQIYTTNAQVLYDAIDVIGADRLIEYLKGD